MRADPICGSGRRHVAYDDASFCARCGEALARNSPAEIDGSAEFRQLGVDPRGEIVAWASGRGLVYAVRRVGRDHTLLEVATTGQARAVGQLPVLDDLVTAPIGTSRGVFFISLDCVHAYAGTSILRWAAPDGHVLVGAVGGSLGELWVAAVSRKGGLRILVAGTDRWRRDDEIEVPGFGGAIDTPLTLAARSSRPFRGEILVWGGGKSAVIYGKAVVSLRNEPLAPFHALRVRDRNLPILAQAAWQPDGWRLLPRERDTVAAAKLDGARLVVREVPASGGAVLTASGRLYCQSGGEMALFESPGIDISSSVELASLEGSSSAASPLVGACPLSGSAIVQSEQGTLWLLEGAHARRLEPRSQPVSGIFRALPAMPPIWCRDRIWAARSSPQGLEMLELGVGAVPPASLAAERANAR